MGFMNTIKQVMKNVANPKEAVEENRDVVDKLVDEKLRQAQDVANQFVGLKVEELREVADSFMGSKVQELKTEALMMVDLLEQRIDAKLDEFEKRLDERLQKELHWKLVGLRWTLIFVLLTTAVGIAYHLIQKAIA